MSEEKKQSAGHSRAKNATSGNETSAPKKEETETVRSNAAGSGRKNGSRASGGSEKSARTSESEQPKIESSASDRESAKRSESTPLGNQFLVLLFAALALFIGVCFAFRDDVGVIGYAISYVFYGLFGVGALLVPFLLVQLALYWKRDVESGAVKYKYIAAIFTLLFFSVLAHTMHCLITHIPKLTISNAFSGESLGALFEKGLAYRGGGFLGGLLASALICAVGYPGTLMFGTLFFAVFVMTLFGLTPVECIQRYRFYRKRSQSARVKLQEEQAVRREEAQAKKAETAVPRKKAKPMHASGAAGPKVRRADDIDQNIFDDNASFGPDDPSVNADSADTHRKKQTDADRSRRRADEESPLGHRASADARAFADDADTVPIPVDNNDAFHAPKRPSGNALYVTPEEISFADDEEMPNFVPVKRKRKSAVRSDFESEKFAEQKSSSDADAPVEESFDQAPPVQPVTQELPSSTKAYDAPQAKTRKTKRDDAAVEKRTEEPLKNIVDHAVPVSEESEAEERKCDDIAIRPPEMSVPAPNTEEDDDGQEVIPRQKEYEFPPISLLQEPVADGKEENVSQELRENADKIIQTLKSFNVSVNISNVSRGPTITRYEVEPSAGTRVRSILNLLDDIALSLATSGVRSDGIITGKSAIGIEVPNKVTNTVFVRSLIDDMRFSSAKSKLTASLGMDVSGAPVYLDIAKMPHLLIAGATGQGKSVCINSLLISLLYKARPDEMKLILVDPKKVELNVYNGLPHLLVPVVFDPKKAAGSLHWAVQEMERRFELIEAQRVRNLAQYNAAIADDPHKEKLPQIVIVIDELADLMMSAPDDVETSICRLAQKARAAGMHLIIGTQRPSADVITGLIKANIPSRIAFTVSNQIDSRIILDTQGAEKLIGRGDMLYLPIGSSKPIRVQGAFVSETEIENIIEFIKAQSRDCTYSDDVIKEIEKAAATCGQKKKGAQTGPLDPNDIAEEEDPMLDAAIELAVEEGKISTSLIQRRLSLGYGRAAKLIDVMEHRGIVSPPEGQRPRKVLITREQYLEMRMNHIDGDGTADGADEAPFDV